MSDEIIISKKRIKHYIILFVLYAAMIIGAGLLTLRMTGDFFIGFSIAGFVAITYPNLTDYRDWVNETYPKENKEE